MIPALVNLKIHGESECINFLFEEGIIEETLCSLCGSNVYREKKIFRCVNRSCRKTVSIFAHTFFSNNKLGCSNTMVLGYYWLCDLNFTAIYEITKTSPTTVVKYMRLFRQLVIETLDEKDETIGGNNVIVEIDESKFQSRRGEGGVWVLGGVERTNEKKCFLKVVEQRDARTITRIVRKYVKRGSIVYTDMWRGYGSLNRYFRHVRINHGNNFVDPVTGAHTNTIEGTWNGIKIKIRPRDRNEDSINDHLLEFIWRRKNRGDLWKGFLDAICEYSE
jgi:transposase-like protein